MSGSDKLPAILDLQQKDVERLLAAQCRECCWALALARAGCSCMQVPPPQHLCQRDSRTLHDSTDIGAKQLDKNMSSYLWKRRADGINLIDIQKTWNKVVLAARVIAAIGGCCCALAWLAGLLRGAD